jgi:methylmalonyl-CoA mutase cobalamin-binding subunit
VQVILKSLVEWWCILPSEIAELQAYGITRIYAPDDGRSMGLQGMINDLVNSLIIHRE